MCRARLRRASVYYISRERSFTWGICTDTQSRATLHAWRGLISATFLHETICCTSPSCPHASNPSLCRRISNRESARRLRKQRNDKLNSLVAQQDGLHAENEALGISITAAKTVLQRLHAENAAMRAKLGEDAQVRQQTVLQLCSRNS